MCQRYSIKKITTIKRYTSIVILSLLLASCDSKNDNTNKPNPGTNTENGKNTTVLNATVSPSNNAVGVERNTIVSATFNKDVMANTITSSNFLLSDVNIVPATVNYTVATKTATLTATKPLAMLSQYSVQLTNNISDLSGKSLANKNWSFTTRDGRWSTTSMLLENNANDALSPHIATNENGSAIAVWSQSDGTSYNIMANRYSPATGWDTAEFISSSAVNVANPEVVIDSNGNALAVWQQQNTTNPLSLIYVSRLTISNGGAAGVWSTARIISVSSNTKAALNPKIAVDSNGNAIVVWMQGGTVAGQFSATLWANYYTASGTASWAIAKRLESSFSSSEQHQVMFDSNNMVSIIWRLATPSISSTINVIRFAGGTDLSTVRQSSSANISNTSIGIVSSPQISSDANGDLHAVWSYESNLTGATSTQIMTASYNSKTETWGVAQSLTSITSKATYPAITTDSKGNLIVIWQQLANAKYSIWSKHFRAGQWGTSTLLQANVGTKILHSPQIISDANGNALAVWSYDNAQVQNIYSSRYRQSTDSWSTAAKMDRHPDATPVTEHALFAAGVNGEVIAVWLHGSQTVRSIFSNSFK